MSVPGYTVGDTSITVGSTSNWSTDTGVTFAIDQAQVVNGVEVQIAGTYNEYVGTVASGTSVTNVDWALGSGDRNYASGALTRVYIPVSAERENRLIDGLLVSHDQDGTLKAGAVDVAAVLANDVVETAKIKDKAVTLPKINGGSTAGVLTTDASGNVTPLNQAKSISAFYSTATWAPTTETKLGELAFKAPKVKVSFSAELHDGNSGAARSTSFYIYRDGVKLTPNVYRIGTTNGQQGVHGSGVHVFTEGDGLSHTYAVYYVTAASPAIAIDYFSMSVEAVV